MITLTNVYSLKLSDQAKADYNWFEKTQSASFMARINRLLHQLEDTPRRGIGRPKPLGWDLEGYWSVRIDREHRIVYEIREREVVVLVLSMRGHYEAL